MAAERGQWGSRIGFVLAAAGSAVGLGSVWKFPYMAGANGGSAFLIMYLAAVLGIGMSMMLAELAVGRAARKDAVGAYSMLGGQKWSVFGYLSLTAAFIILSFYCVVGGWTVGYLLKAVRGTLLAPADAEGFKLQFSAFIGDPAYSLVFSAVFMLMTVGIILGGVQGGIERVSKVLMPLLLLLMILMIARSLTLPGAVEGVKFLLVPDLGKITPRVLTDAMGFACFSLSLGFGGMLTYGSYMGKGENIVKAAFWVVGLQIVYTLTAGFMVMPAVFAFGMEPSAGPGLSYITLPAVFKAMQGGAFFAAVFFSLLLIAALTSSVSILEPIVAHLIDRHGVSRKKASCGTAAACFLAGIPAAWSFGPWEEVRVFGLNPFELMDYVTSNIMLPINVLAGCLLMGWFRKRTLRRELYPGRHGNDGKDCPLPGWVSLVEAGCRFIAPAAVAATLLAGIL
ncbi:MAG: sodium-dependent transporter [Desulfovibrio sp.]|jgi:NSS family neurotransmitter:Na+ symporter|nr:sodium-dependent transporter [Desulfovibrio sp.]